MKDREFEIPRVVLNETHDALMIREYQTKKEILSRIKHVRAKLRKTLDEPDPRNFPTMYAVIYKLSEMVTGSWKTELKGLFFNEQHAKDFIILYPPEGPRVAVIEELPVQIIEPENIHWDDFIRSGK